MSQIGAITKREFNSYFKSAMGWVLFAIYAFVSGLYFSSMLMGNYVDVSQILQFMRRDRKSTRLNSSHTS